MEKPSNIKDKSALAYIEFLELEKKISEDKLKIYDESLYSDSYLTIYNQLKSFNSQLQLGEETTTINSEGVQVKEKKGFVDLFADKDSKEFDRVKWYFDNILELNKNLDELRKLMTPEQSKEVDRKAKEAKVGIAEKLALKASNG